MKHREQTPIPPADLKRQEAQREGEARRQAYLATLDPRQRGDLDPMVPPGCPRSTGIALKNTG